MLHIILLILKIIGIVIACIIGLILLLICSILFVAFRYSGKVKFDKQVEYSLCGHWLLWAVSFKVEGRQTNPRIIVRLFGYPLIDTARPKKEKAAAENEKAKNAEKPEKTVAGAIDKKPEKTGNPEKTEAAVKVEQGEKIEKIEKPGKTENPEKTEAAKKTGNPEKTETAEKTGNPEKTETAKKTEKVKKTQRKEIVKSTAPVPKPSLRARISGIKDKIIGKIKEKIAAIKAKLRKIGNIFKKLKNKKEKLEAIFLSKEGRATIRRLKVQAFKILKHLKFKKLRGRLHFGFDDPATTGKVLGMASILYPIYRGSLKLEPDFNGAVIDGELYIRGRIRLFNLLLPAAKVKFDKGFNKMLKDIKNL